VHGAAETTCVNDVGWESGSRTDSENVGCGVGGEVV
jgi:hypothetical protein